MLDVTAQKLFMRDPAVHRACAVGDCVVFVCMTAYTNVCVCVCVCVRLLSVSRAVHYSSLETDE